MNAQHEYKETVKRARAAESIADELAIWREFTVKVRDDSSAFYFFQEAFEHIRRLEKMRNSTTPDPSP